MSTPGGGREVARMAWPLALGMLSFTLMGVVDTLLMGRVSTTAQAGVAVASMTVGVFLSFFRGVASGRRPSWPPRMGPMIRRGCARPQARAW